MLNGVILPYNFLKAHPCHLSFLNATIETLSCILQRWGYTIFSINYTIRNTAIILCPICWCFIKEKEVCPPPYHGKFSLFCSIYHHLNQDSFALLWHLADIARWGKQKRMAAAENNVPQRDQWRSESGIYFSALPYMWCLCVLMPCIVCQRCF